MEDKISNHVQEMLTQVETCKMHYKKIKLYQRSASRSERLNWLEIPDKLYCKVFLKMIDRDAKVEVFVKMSNFDLLHAACGKQDRERWKMSWVHSLYHVQELQDDRDAVLMSKWVWSIPQAIQWFLAIFALKALFCQTKQWYCFQGWKNALVGTFNYALEVHRIYLSIKWT